MMGFRDEESINLRGTRAVTGMSSIECCFDISINVVDGLGRGIAYESDGPWEMLK